jgi:hypothetical protein
MRSLAILAASILMLTGVVLALGNVLAQSEVPALGPSHARSQGAAPQGASSMRTETRAVGSFHRIALSSLGNLEVRQGPTEALSVTAADNVLPQVITQVSDGTLELRMRSETQLPPNTEIRYAVTVKSLDGLNLAGLGRANVIDLRSDSLEVNVSGSGEIVLTRLDAGSLAVKISGKGDITASGRAARQKVQLSGLGSYKARELATRDATVVLSGSGSMIVNVERTLDATVSGVGDVEYHGSPTVKRKVSGMGRIRQG